ncbi:MAG: TIGR03915 family putative DNA repair protein, partial [Sinobacteraceae bacterium]|nr:TIGR03915 family putative DNA repair protein [Nevskiaceae bacterium]
MPAAAVHSFEQWRITARHFLAQQLLPEQIVWSDSRQPTLFESAATPSSSTAVAALSIPRRLRQLLQDLACYRDAARWELMYRLSWRVLHEQRELLDNDADPDVRTAQLWQKSVHHDVHRMHAFVRFHELAGEHGRQYVAWFEPRHEILRAAAPFFEKRFPNMRWMIATPDGAAAWDGRQTHYIESPPRDSLPREDQTHALWRTYYRNICNAARINPQLMRQHMPSHYWQHLPEASEIKPLIDAGHRRTQQALHAIPHPDNLQTPRGIAASLAALAAPADTPVSCRRCELWRHATQAVLGEGPRDAAIMLVGEQPGDEEDLRGRPFVGPAGQKLDQLLLRAGLDRRQLYVTNAVKHFKWQPRGKRRLHQRPDQQELRACHEWLEQEIAGTS